MYRMLMLAACAAFSLVQTANAVEVTETVTTSATPKTVWALVGKFEDIVNWLPNVASSPADKGSKVGSVRTITLKAPGRPDGGRGPKPRAKAIATSYKIDKVDPKVLPVTAYTSTISVTKTGAGSTMTWHGSFTAAGTDDASAQKAVSGLYRSGLDNVKTLVEK